MKKALISIICLVLLYSQSLRADEGMWIPLFLSKYNISDMQKKGFKLTAEDIYSVNKASMKDAVMIFGRGCTAELISGEGLIITNHHCGYNNIQQHSSLEHDYLTNGFWAMDKSQELTNPNLSVTFLVSMEDVTDKVLEGVNDKMSESTRNSTIERNIDRIEKAAKAGTHYEAKVKSFFYGNEYYLFLTEVFKDIRFVGAPPSAIGKFGGDTDNWVWPRHTGDFSLFRIYANKNNEPAEYSPDNVPYKPKKYFPISIKGVKKGDFTFVFGYPGHTQEYLPSYAVEMIIKTENPHQINIRQKKIDIMNVDMNASPEIRIKYSAKHAGASNAWKKWIGETKGIERMKGIERKQEQEKAFTDWVHKDENRKQKYGNILPTYKSIYTELTPFVLAEDYFSEAIYSLDIMKLCTSLNSLFRINNSTTKDEQNKIINAQKKYVKNFFKDYNLPTDKKIFKELIKLYYDNLDKKFHPSIFKFRGFLSYFDKNKDNDFEQFTNYIYTHSFLFNEEKLIKYLDEFTPASIENLRKDPAFRLYIFFLNTYFDEIMPTLKRFESPIDSLNRIYMKAQREWQADKVFFPDANSTLRVSYGKVDDYTPVDGVRYLHYTTIEGIMEKDNPNIYDYDVPIRLKELYKTKDYGEYAENGEMHVSFIASNHTTGGNSGSPVLNANGELIGINFDRNWEGTMSDIMYDPSQCRNISLDIRYALFIIDKFAGAKHLIKEMTIIRDEKKEK